jgi:tetratricopeptide (TPR) repeat protein
MRQTLTLVALLLGISALAQNNTITAFSKSYTYETNYEYKKAIDDMLSVYDTDSYSINFRLGWLYYLNGDLNKSKTHYQNAIKLQKNSVEARLGLVYPVYAMKNTDDVIRIYQEILSIDKQNTTARYRIASLYYTRKNWTEAVSNLNKILDLYPFDFDSNYLLGNVYIKLGKINEAKRVLNIALQYNPTSSELIEILKGL